MKNLASRVFGNGFRNALACIVLLCAFFVGQEAAAQSIAIADNSPIVENIVKDFQATIHPVANTLLVKVHFVNPIKERVSILIQNSRKESVYKKKIAGSPVFHDSYDMGNLPDGIYTIKLRTGSNTYPRTVAIQTQQARIAQVL